jgi:ATP-dependent Clp protease ATP-binding subunit ClpA
MPIDPNRFTRKTQEAFAAAQALARDAGNTEIAPEHLLRALLDQPEGVVSGVPRTHRRRRHHCSAPCRRRARDRSLA